MNEKCETQRNINEKFTLAKLDEFFGVLDTQCDEVGRLDFFNRRRFLYLGNFLLKIIEIFKKCILAFIH